MTESPMGEDPTKENGEECDDLTRIRGIGPIKQQWLRASFDVCTFRDLANLSVNEIEARLRSEGQVASRSDIENWISQAQELAGTTGQQSLQPAQKSESSPLEEVDWRSFASFMVEFQARRTAEQAEEQQTVVRYLEVDRVKTWSGIESEQLRQWIFDQLNVERGLIPARNLQPLQAETVTTAIASSVTLEIIQVKALLAPLVQVIVDRSNRVFPTPLRSNQPFTLEIFFTVDGDTADLITRQGSSYCVEVYAHHGSTGETLSLGEKQIQNLIEGQLSYTTWLPGVTLQQPGTYRLQIIVTIEGMPVLPGIFEVPLLQVI